MTHDGQKATTRRVLTYVANQGVLDDLDVRASDLLQANCVIWVEGPSDRLYINRWIELWGDGNLREGNHYQCMFYGGRLLAHISAEDPERHRDDGIAILRLNRNAVILMDSDKKTPDDVINDTKRRIEKEMNEISGMVWITDGREIENYIPCETIAQYYNRPKLPPLKQFESIAEYICNEIGNDECIDFKRDKVGFAAGICPLLTKESIQDKPDLSEKLNLLCQHIRKWNDINE